MASPVPMARFALPSGATFEAPEDLTDEEVSRYAVENFPDEFPEYQRRPAPSSQPRSRPGQEEPGLLGRFTGSFAEGLARGTGSVLPGLGAGFSDLIGDEEGFQESLGSIRENSQSASEFNPLPSSFAEVRQKYREDGLGSAMLEMADLAAQGTGGSMAYVAPSLAVVGLGTLGVLSAPATVLALGGTAALSTVQYFSEQLDRANDEAERKGEKLSSEDVNLAKQLAFAMGQTGLERASLLTTGLFKNVLKSEVVKNAANSAAANTILKFADDIVPKNAAARAVTAGLSEVVTETGQTAFERAAAGLPVAPDGEDPEEYQRAFDEYVETWVSAMLVGTGMGGAMGHIDAKEEKHRPGIEEDVIRPEDGVMPEDMDPAEIEAVMKPVPVLSKAELEAQAKAKESEDRYRAEQINILTTIRNSDAKVAEKIESRLGFVSDKAKEVKKKFRSEAVAIADKISKRERTVADVQNILDHRGIDYESTPDSVAMFNSFIRRTAGVSSLDQAKPAQLDRIYRAIESNQTGSNLAMPDVDVAANLLRAMAAKKKLSTADVTRVATGVPVPRPVASKATAVDLAKPTESPIKSEPEAESEFDNRTAGILGTLVQRGVVKKTKNTKTGKHTYSVPENVAAVIADPEFDTKSDLILELSRADRGRAGPRYPIHSEVSDLVTPDEFTAIRSIHRALGVADPKAEASDQVPATGVEYDVTSTPQSKWVVRDDTGKVRRVERSRKRADRFFTENPDTGLQPPKLERGVVVRENTYSGNGPVKKILKSIPVHFVESGGSEARADAAAWIKEKTGSQSTSLEETHFLGTKERGSAGSVGRVAKLQRMARSADPRQFKEAVNTVKMGQNPLSTSRVLKSYGFGVDANSDAAKDVHTEGVEVELKVPISLTGRMVKRFFPVTVKAGVLKPDGKGFGAAKIGSHSTDFANTKYGTWRSALDKIVTEMGNEQSIRTGKMTVFPDGYGRVVAILQEPRGLPGKPIEIDVEKEIQQLYLDAPKIQQPLDYRGEPQIDPEYHATLKKRAAEIRENAAFAKANPDIVAQRLADKSEPITAIFDMVTDERGKPSYHVVNMFVGRKDMTVEMWGPDQAKGHASFYGRNASPRSLAILNRPENAMRLKPGETSAVDITFNSPVLRSAAKMKPSPPKKPNTIWKYVNDAVTEWTGKPDAFTRFRRAFVDHFDVLQKAEGRLISDGHKEQLVHIGTMGVARDVSNAANLSNESIHHGNVEFVPTGTLLDADQQAMQSIEGVFLVKDFELVNESEPLLVANEAGDGLVRKTFKSDGMHSERLGNHRGGLATIWASLVKDGQNLTGQMFQYAMAVRAWNMINVEGKSLKEVPKLVQDNMSEWLKLPNAHPEIGVAYSNMQRLNTKSIELLVQSGLKSREEAKKLLANFDYTPFMVEQTNDGQIFDRLLGGVSHIDATLPYKGWFELKGDQQMVDPIQAYLGNYTRIVASAINNITRSRAVRDQVALGLARRWSDKLGTGSKLTIYENGVKVDYEIDDMLAFETIKGELGQDWGQTFRNSKYLKWVTTKPSEWLRESVSRSPDFALTNVIRDSLQVMMINGLGVKAVGDIWKRAIVNMGKASSGKEMSRSFRFLKRNAVVTGWGHVGFQGSVRDVASDINEALSSSAEGRQLKAYQKVWDIMGRWSAASESASREIVFEDSYNYHTKELSADPDLKAHEIEAIAISQALHDAREVLNFTRHGNNQYLKLMLQLAPFTGARIQGLDIVGRALFGYAPVGYKRMSPDQVRRAISQRAGIIAAASAGLAMLNYGDDDYENEDGYVRDMNWLIPIPGTNTHFALPIPFELGIISKVVPEQLTRMAIGAVDGNIDHVQRDALRSARHAAVNTVGLSGLLPVASRPLIEKFSNKSIFTGRPIVSFYEEMKPTAEQYGPNTTIQARAMSSAGLSALGISPKLIDTEVRTIGGGLGVYAWSVMDHVVRLALPGIPNNPVPRLADTIGFKRFVKDEFQSGVIGEIYEFQRELDQSFSRFKDASREEKVKLAKENAANAMARPAVHKLTARLKKQRDAIDAIKDSDMSGIEKRARINEVERLNKDIFSAYRKIRSRHDMAN